jgi:hypothetical protein
MRNLQGRHCKRSEAIRKRLVITGLLRRSSSQWRRDAAFETAPLPLQVINFSFLSNREAEDLFISRHSVFLPSKCCMNYARNHPKDVLFF